MILAFLLALVTMPVSHALASSVLLTASVSDGSSYEVCSGVVVARRHGSYVVATAEHCTKGATVKHAWFYDGDCAKVVRVIRSKKADAALLVVKPHHWHSMAHLSQAVTIGSPYFLVGYSSGDQWSYANLISRNGARVFYDAGPYYLFDGPTVYLGDSGAAVFDEIGNVVGILFAVDVGNDRPGVVYVTPIWYIKDLVRRLR